ncbi:hypothetical protein PC123_g9506 [Phytophthora cactorum]|nr:hypothetical protein PC120_g22712 [Phytophthora cactorum]KAG4055408.1 hypothetical protein PC123_g9506 [Phytophthora cactorum]
MQAQQCSLQSWLLLGFGWGGVLRTPPGTRILNGCVCHDLLCTCMDNHRAEMQVLVKYNRRETRKMEMTSFTDNKNVDQTEFVWVVVSQ